jgi:2-iminobutanoate/2-iminopropanoate deaminase
VGLGVVNGGRGRDGAPGAVGLDGGAPDGAGIHEQSGAVTGDFEGVVVAEADEIEGAGEVAGDEVEVVHDDAAAREFALEDFAVEADVRVSAGVGSDAVEVGVVIAEDDVDGAGEAAAELVDNEGGAEVAAAEQGVTGGEGGQRGGEVPDVVVDVGEDAEFHFIGDDTPANARGVIQQTTMIERIFPQGTPAPRGPYSPAIRAGDFVFVSGQGPIDPATDQFSYGDIQHETRVTLNNVKRILEAAGASLADVVKVNVYLKHGEHFAAMNEVYKEFFGEQRPTRTTVAVAFADPTMQVEIDCIAYRQQ